MWKQLHNDLSRLYNHGQSILIVRSHLPSGPLVEGIRHGSKQSETGGFGVRVRQGTADSFAIIPSSTNQVAQLCWWESAGENWYFQVNKNDA